jgi:aspartyl/asparaginyl beta-hydroxylase (cupin superfamily)
MRGAAVAVVVVVMLALGQVGAHVEDMSPEEAAEVAEATARGLFHFRRPGPVYDAALFPKFDALRAHWEVLRDEALAIEHDMQLHRTHPSFEHPTTQTFLERMAAAGNSGWSTAWAKDGGWRNYGIVFHGEPIPGQTETLCPKTTALLRTIPGIRMAGFSKLLPNARIETHIDHTGLNNGSMAFHIYLTGSARMRVADGWYEHVPGHALVFNSNIPHEVINGPEERIILYMDIDLQSFLFGTEGLVLTHNANAHYGNFD